MTEEFLVEPTTSLDIGIDPPTPDAGASLAIKMSTKDGTPLPAEGLEAVLLDARMQTLATATVDIDETDGTGRASLNVTAPASVGECRWSLALRAGEETLAQADVTFEVRAHAIAPIVWNVPSAISAGEMFRFHVGLRCSSACVSENWGFVVEDADGQELHSGVMGSTPAPGTDALHFAEVELRAPDHDGRYVWRVRPVDPGLDLPHAPAAADLHLNVVRKPDHVIRVLALDALSREPVARAKVVAHPFRTMTDAEGRAEIAVPAGAYTVFVSGHQYFAFRQTADLAQQGDVEIVAEMHVDRAYDEVDEWA
ncbi:hypothetical protein N8I71_07595 [Roseibacterium sp. SDUM158016]|uniref:hypothetical protein n=1 Tax=Roseicyclus sediminis TaxID=2980997 RepID=UPI0021D223EF|nr:hypothetical protein [Roseibacterium sp. SDUM158016]MCU4652690.1 hypothetical protein [Roseibacterium sp. SDUM158016]